MTMKEEILKVMKEAGRPMSAGEVEKLLKADRKEIDKAFKALKEEGKIVSPVRCKWEPAEYLPHNVVARFSGLCYT